ncbi:E3 ubiquitin-protein ligase HEL2-like [Camellia sinensis]|uniref:E3 ubiquitin-protein ligase HEL2-like n=1 Tax=Camellia sinensis TaxID=4442 RepID=UPI001036CAAE|nr:E3 ubiquitin-protein ligase HEL2-like [Camellia sinensis]XP_028101561.1 E3 ubiquitin-protein ligase HEL2-like [Camellia sinensis]
MDDTCAVCAETLEWAAYGQCGHHEVCSTCIARLRFICDDRRCCICKSESNIIFVTKALGDYTRMINDFSIFPVDPTEGQVGPYWYHEGTQAFFDDLDHYKMITGMCKLSCNVCDKKDDQGSEDLKRRGKFRNVAQLKSHLFHHHKLFMCSLCLEGRKIFICEQKLYTRAQLNRHINFGDSEVDGSESERGGFMGHPMCEFCRNPFYGDNELYTHMSTEHYTCHVCQRQHPGQYDYFKNYDDLEIHFRQEHFLCEDEACLEKKFIVFATESEMKRHNAMEHGGRMSRSKRNAAFQIPISFQYRSSRERDQNRRGRVFQPDYSDSQLSLAIEASLATANANMPRGTSSRAQTESDHRETGEINSILESFESLASADSEPSSRNRQAMGQNSRNNTPLETSSFPPLPVAARNNHQKQRNGSEGLGRNTMAARLRHRNHVTVLNASQARPTASRQPTSLIVGSSQLRPISSFGHVLSSGSASFITKPATVNEVGPSNFSSSMQIRSTTADAQSASSASSSTKTRSSKKVSHSTSTPNLVDRGSLDPAVSEFPPVSATRPNKLTKNTQPLPKAEDVRTANKSLVQRIRSDLEFDEDKYAAFKVISSEYRQGLIDTGEYVAYVFQFGLSHLIPELARLCPDAQKQKELVEAYSICSLRGNGPWENSAADNSGLLKHKKSSKKGKEKCEDNGISSSNGALEDSIINSLRELQSNYKPSKEVEILSKDGYRSAKGKSTNLDDDDDEQRVKNHSEPAAGGLKKSSGTSGGNKPRKKTSKFNRVRLGEGSQAAVLDLTNSDSLRDSTLGQSDGNTDTSERLPVRGAWKNGGGRRLVANLR